MPQFPLLTAEQASPLANLVSNAMKAYQTGINAKYQPQMIKADIFNKEFSPLGQIASSPLALAMLPDQQKQMASMISRLLAQNGGSLAGNAQSTGNSDMGNMAAMMGNNPMANQGGNMSAPSQPQMGGNPMMVGGQSTSNLPQAGSDLGNEVRNKALSTYQTQVYPAGTSYYDPASKSFKVTDTGQQLSNDQVEMGAIQTTIPYIKKLQDEGDELLKAGRTRNRITSTIGAILSSAGVDKSELKKMGLDADYYDKLQRFQRDQKNAAQRLQEAYSFGNTLEGSEKAHSIIAPSDFESKESYRLGLDKELGNLSRQFNAAKGRITGGFNVTPGAAPEVPTDSMNQPGAVSNAGGISEGAKMLAKTLKLPLFKSSSEFQNWYKKQDPMVKQAVRLNMGAAQ